MLPGDRPLQRCERGLRRHDAGDGRQDGSARPHHQPRCGIRGRVRVHRRNRLRRRLGPCRGRRRVRRRPDRAVGPAPVVEYERDRRGRGHLHRARARDRPGREPGGQHCDGRHRQHGPPGARGASVLKNPVAGSPTLLWSNQPNQTYTVSRNGVSQGTATSPWTDPAVLAPGTYDYGVVATDAVGNPSPAGHVSVTVISPSLTAPRAISANSPTNAVPHVTWQPPVSFLVGGWKVYRDGALLTTLGDPATSSFDDTGLAAQGPHTYAVQAVNGTSAGDLSSPVSVTYDTMAPVLDPASATANPNGSISLNWPDATDPSPGSGVADYVVQRAQRLIAADQPVRGDAGPLPDPPGQRMHRHGYQEQHHIRLRGVRDRRSRKRRGARSRVRGRSTPRPRSGRGPQDRQLRPSTPASAGRCPHSRAPTPTSRAIACSALKAGKPPLNANDGKSSAGRRPRGHRLRRPEPRDRQEVSFAIYAYDGVPNYSTPASCR